MTGSFAVLTLWGNGWRVRQGGPRRLWDAIESAVAVWEEYGSPNRAAFGVTADHDTQTVWLGSPDGPQWPLPTDE